MKTSKEDSELQFLRTFRDYVYWFNNLELNINYCLSHAGQEGEYSSKVAKFSRLTFDQKVHRLRKLVTQNNMDKIFLEWFESVDYCRKMRNKIIHGHWEFVWWVEKQIRYDILAPTKEKGELTIEEFTREFEFLKKTTEDFNHLRNRYEIK